MNFKPAVVIITKDSESTLEKTLKSIRDLYSELIVVDNNSKDATTKIAMRYQAKVYFREEKDLGRQKAYAIKLAKNNWILLIDSDEVVSLKLKKEILSLKKISGVNAYRIPYQNHFLGRKIYYGGENYAMIRLFNKTNIIMEDSLVHEKIKVSKGKILTLKNKIYHYSYRSLKQMFFKFTDYALRDAEQKLKNEEKSSLKKIFFYPLHMFWARFVEDKGYRDGMFRIPLDLGFAYMEFLTYLVLFFRRI